MPKLSHLNPAPNQAVGDWEQLVKDIFECEDCSKSYRLTGRPKSGGYFVPCKPTTAAAPDQTMAGEREPRHFKFPPIGAPGRARILFVATCPRYTDKPGTRTDNARLHDFAMTDLYHFESLAQNLDHRGKAYVARELFYTHHLGIVRDVYDVPFGEVAVATEMYLCATRPGSRYLYKTSSPCAKQFLKRLIKLHQPQFIVTFGSGIPKFFRKHISDFFRTECLDGDVKEVVVIHLPFPTPTEIAWQEMDKADKWTGRVINSLKERKQDGSKIERPDWVARRPSCAQEVWKYCSQSDPLQML
jgi:uracil-DNA glycosylase